jgi:hypothetical protein
MIDVDAEDRHGSPDEGASGNRRADIGAFVK